MPCNHATVMELMVEYGTGSYDVELNPEEAPSYAEEKQPLAQCSFTVLLLNNAFYTCVLKIYI